MKLFSSLKNFSMARKMTVLSMFLCVNALAGFDLAPFQSYVDSVVPGSRFGLSIRSVKSGVELGQIRGSEKFTPASTLKTLTTATALHFLPLDYEPKTEISLLGSIQKNKGMDGYDLKPVFVGTVNVRGEGDPNFSGRYYADPFDALYAMADSIKSLGIDTIRGNLNLDTSYYTGPWKAEHWRKNFYDAWYGAEIAPLNFNDNCTMIRFKPGAKPGDRAIAEIVPDVGYVVLKNELQTVKGRSKRWTWALDPVKPEIVLGGTIGTSIDSNQLVLPVRNPVAYFRAALMHAFKEKGLSYVPDSTVTPGIEIKKFTFSAAPLLSILDEINQRSQNFHAEALFRNLGAQMAGEGSVEGGKAMERKFLAEMGIDSTHFEVWDGCGLSPKNKLLPSTETLLLTKMARHPKGSYYINSFAGPGAGTGSKRQLDNPYPWLTRFKTGFIGEAHALVGYVFPMDGDTLALAMYLNDTGKNPDAKLKDVLDTLWTRIVMQTNDSYASLMEMKSLWLSARHIKPFHERLDYFSKAMIGKPYLLAAMGESYLDTIENKPLVNMDSVNCVTYLEHALAMARAADEDSIFNTLQRIRYYKGIIDFAHRKHYMIVDWVNGSKYARVLPLPGDTIIQRTMPKKEFFKAKGITRKRDDEPTDLRYLPYDKAMVLMSRAYEGPFTVVGIAFVAKSEKIDVTHTGFVVLRPGQLPQLRHASSLQKQVVEVPLTDYLESRRGKLPGIVLFEFIPQ
ncbi:MULTISPECIES: D-alanyl-D-alanine carboxypeptidase/D-alanyl-D-alanine-endopeptidase [unclassified Fibrobacter]|uniref:D-alanyl-D-alanine carboxypeptidase/D-alanyl-D-alanine endopeptidase n=1 Tax=unclassified Fibrobacter TaxID=2634177 RepID=UPI000914A472|nr:MULTISPECIES: D-alanyl-D-alanine carboxypeptidase/D-alanyl-D-alanine-endopeptidase [unclassified Fibrobacter]MCQ2099771.1 D-alanyl-D-alanine carboxypeptidase/D-alanyl-D-alanine-endopeptidase [Fibrobacter sp.]OWV05158.1 D-alanyl-D-alanine carboxypeptidase/D-alanyl-D-alanine-endopeptidase [Fibrobacter sp. UWH3]SHL47722.1 D-alanyl-D-alanine carboxypeptidase / D-alanyl-D-alanine-endopeptidase (penicillin-binding protein 4) [Fibrobacter sp. UWH6]